MKKKVSWKGGSEKRCGLDAKQVQSEFERIKKVYGLLNPHNVVSEAHKTGSILHGFFDWDDETAAAKYRLQQARNLINEIVIVVVANGEKREIGAYEVVQTTEGRTYKNVSLLNPDEIEQIKRTVFSELDYLKVKLSYYADLKPTIEHIERAQATLA